jgi:hypothetical protein
VDVLHVFMHDAAAVDLCRLTCFFDGLIVHVTSGTWFVWFVCRLCTPSLGYMLYVFLSMMLLILTVVAWLISLMCPLCMSIMYAHEWTHFICFVCRHRAPLLKDVLHFI